MEQLKNVSVYRTRTHIIITGIPAEGDTTHHCDEMGCGQEHVFYRLPLPVADWLERAEAEEWEHMGQEDSLP